MAQVSKSYAETLDLSMYTEHSYCFFATAMQKPVIHISVRSECKLLTHTKRQFRVVQKIVEIAD